MESDEEVLAWATAVRHVLVGKEICLAEATRMIRTAPWRIAHGVPGALEELRAARQEAKRLAERILLLVGSTAEQLRQLHSLDYE